MGPSGLPGGGASPHQTQALAFPEALIGPPCPIHTVHWAPEGSLQGHLTNPATSTSYNLGHVT
jgi:hypothetical protein